MANVDGDYYDALFRKRSLVVLFHMEITQARSPARHGSMKLRAHRVDRTEYGRRAFPTAHTPPSRKKPLGPFVSYWTERFSAAAVTGNGGKETPSAYPARHQRPGGSRLPFPPTGRAHLSARPHTRHERSQGGHGTRTCVCVSESVQ